MVIQVPAVIVVGIVNAIYGKLNISRQWEISFLFGIAKNDGPKCQRGESLTKQNNITIGTSNTHRLRRKSIIVRCPDVKSRVQLQFECT